MAADDDGGVRDAEGSGHRFTVKKMDSCEIEERDRFQILCSMYILALFVGGVAFAFTKVISQNSGEGLLYFQEVGICLCRANNKNILYLCMHACREGTKTTVGRNEVYEITRLHNVLGHGI